MEETRTAPWSEEAEISVLGAMLLEEDARTTAVEILDASDFYRASHRLVFDAFARCLESGMEPDVVVLADELETTGDLEAAGGMQYLAGLVDAVPSASNVEYHAKIVRNKAVQRRLIRAGRQIVDDAYGARAMDVEKLLDHAESEVFDVAKRTEREEASTVADILPRTFESLEERIESTEVPGIKTGFRRLDRMTSGLNPGDYVVIAARPSMGKTSLATNLTTNAALQHDTTVGVFSLEMTKNQLVERMLSSVGRVDSQKLRIGDIDAGDHETLRDTARLLHEAPIVIDDTPAISALELRTKARRMKREHDVDMVIVDYLQLMRGSANLQNRERQVSDISQTIKSLAKDLSIPVVALSQLNRRCEMREDKRPRLSDLRESGSIEQDADLVLFIFREEVYTGPYNDEGENVEGMAEIIVSKQRNGPTGKLTMYFEKKFTTFADERQ